MNPSELRGIIEEKLTPGMEVVYHGIIKELEQGAKVGCDYTTRNYRLSHALIAKLKADGFQAWNTFEGAQPYSIIYIP